MLTGGVSSRNDCPSGQVQFTGEVCQNQLDTQDSNEPFVGVLNFGLAGAVDADTIEKDYARVLREPGGLFHSPHGPGHR